MGWCKVRTSLSNFIELLTSDRFHSTGYPDIERLFKADAALPISNFTSQLKSLASLYSHVYIDLPDVSPRKNTKSLLKYLASSLRGEPEAALESLSSVKRRALTPEVAKLRSVKSKAEQAVMHEAATISGRAHAKTMRFAQPGMTESKLAAHFEYICALSGAQRPAYVPVVASGANALIIHYTRNNMVLGDDELVLIDAGCEYNGYASDISGSPSFESSCRRSSRYSPDIPRFGQIHPCATRPLQCCPLRAEGTDYPVHRVQPTQPARLAPHVRQASAERAQSDWVQPGCRWCGWERFGEGAVPTLLEPSHRDRFARINLFRSKH